MNPPTTKPTDTLYRVYRVYRVYRGGGWYIGVPSWLRAASRGSNVPAVRDSRIGFRCARGGSERKVKP